MGEHLGAQLFVLTVIMIGGFWRCAILLEQIKDKLKRESYPYFELLPLAPKEFDEMRRDYTAFPTTMDWQRMQGAMWPSPDRGYRVFIQPNN